MKKIVSFVLIFCLLGGMFFFVGPLHVKADVPIPVDYCAYANIQTVFIKWSYSCPSGFTCTIQIEEYISGVWTNIASVPASESPQSFSGQTGGRHQYRLRAKLVYYISGIPITMYSGYTNSFDAYVLKTPTGLSVSVNPDMFFSEGNPYLTLKWDPVDYNATQIWIWRYFQDNDLPDQIIKIPSSYTSYNDTMVNPNTKYRYTMQVIRKDDTNIRDDASGYTPTVSKITLPAPPTNYKANAIGKTVYMSWSHTKSCDGYNVYRIRTSPVIGWTLVGTLDKNTLSYNTPAPDYGVYTYKVTAFNVSGDSPKSPTKDVYALKTPTGLTAEALSSTVIKLTWDPLDPNATKVRVSYSTDGMTYSSIGMFALPLSYVNITSLTPNTKYWFKIAVNRDSNESEYSSAATAKTLPVGVPPPAPSSAAAIALNCGRVEVHWQDNSDNEDGFRVERKEGSGAFTEIGAVTANMTVLTDNSVMPGKTYTYRVRSYNAFGNSVYSNETEVVVPLCGPVPTAPSNLTVKLTSVSTVLIKWQDNSDNESGFKLERKVEGGSYSVIKTLSSNIAEATDEGLLPETKYYYRIRAFNDFGYSEYSNEVSITTLSETAKPDAPSSLTVTATSCTEATLNWIDNAINETYFIVERKLEGGTYAVISSTVPANTTTYIDNFLEEGKKYYYRVKATNTNGDSGYSNEVSVIIPPCGTPPAAPSDLVATPSSDTEIKLSFKDNSDNEDGFKIERKEPGGTYQLIAVLPPNSTTHTDSGLTPNTIYYYRVCAFNSYGTSSYSNEANATTQKELKIPNTPTNLTANAISATEIKLTFTDNSDNEDGFKVERKTSSGSYSEIKTLSPGTTSFTDTGLNPNNTYYYRVRAYNAKGYSDYSNEASATTLKLVETIVIRLYINKTTYYVNDTLKTMDVAPIIVESRTLLPIRYVAEALGAEVGWDAKEQKVTITFKGTTIELWIGKNTARVNGEHKPIDPTNPKVTPVIIPPGRTMLPIRFIAENLGCKVDWDGNLKEVKITYPAQ